MTWDTVDVESGRLEVGHVRGFRAYVRDDGTWVIRHNRWPNFRVASDHKTRGTNLELGKAAVIDYMNKRLLR